MQFSFAVLRIEGLQVKADPSDYIIMDSLTGKTGGTLASYQLGAFVTLTFNGTFWQCSSITGLWQVEVS